MKKSLKLKGAIRLYLLWPMLLTPLLVVMAIVTLVMNEKIGKTVTVFALIYILVAVIIYIMHKPKVVGDLVRFASNYGQVQRKLTKELAIPYSVLDMDGHLLWFNDEFAEIVGFAKASRQSIYRIFESLEEGMIPQNEQDFDMHITHNNKYYRVLFRHIFASDLEEDSYWIYEEKDSEKIQRNSLMTMFLYDETEIIALKKDISEQKLIIGLLYIDNYEEALESIDEVRRSLLTALVERKINKSMQNLDAIIKKIEKDKFICIFQNQYLSQLKAARFPILDEVRSVNIGNELPVTISMGLSVDSESFTKGYKQARAAIDLALGRGGDQVVVKEKENTFYYGGKSVSVEKNTRVKARVKAHALRELVESKDEIVVMGHAIGDVDSLGAAIGVYRIAKTLNKKAHIVVNEVTSALRPMVNRFLNNADYEDDLFINSAEAKSIVHTNTLIVMVDVNRPSYSECPELLEISDCIVILDHHRQTGEVLTNAVLSYVEPYASSSCEMVAEILQYISEGVKLKQAEADAMYAGIMVDTNNFLTKTGVRTFEAAAFLRRNGADVTRIRKMFRTEIQEYMAKAAAVTSTEVFQEVYAFATLDNTGLESPTVLAAQVANELLNITDIKASFVFTSFNGKVYVSARSIDELNVQVVMEKLGGGGHMSVAGAQLMDCTLQESISKVKEVLDTMKKEGA